MDPPADEVARLRRRIADLEASEARFRALFEDADEAIVVSDPRSREVVLVNRRAAELLGGDELRLIETTVPGTVAPDGRLAVELVERVGAGETVEFECAVSPEGGAATPLTCRASLIDREGARLVRTELRPCPVDDAEALLSTLMDNLPDYVYFKDRQRRFVRASRSLAEILGHATDGIVGLRDEDLFPPEIHRETVLDDQRVIEDGTPLINRTEGGDMGGVERWVSTTKLPWYAPDGRIRGLYGLSKDITETVVAQRRLERSEARLRLALEASGQGTWELDLRRNEATYDDQHARMLGYEVGEMRGDEREFAESLHPEDRDETFAAFAAVLAGKPSQYDAEFRMRTKSGEYKWIRSTGRVVEWDENGRPVRMVGTHTDIGERRRAHEEALTHSKVLMSMGEGVNFASADGIIRFANPAFEAMFGYEPGELVGRSVVELNALDPGENEALVGSVMGKLRAEGTWSGQFTNRRKDGTVFTTRARLFELTSGAEPIYVSIQEDITEQLEAERKIRSSLREKETLLREVHHRVKNNLQVISSLLHFQSKRVSAPEQRAAFEDGRRRLLAMVLVHEKLYQSNDLSDIDFGDYVRSLASALLASSEERTRLSLDIDADPISLPIESALPAGMILCELLTNVSKYAYPGGGRGAARIEVKREDDIRITVADEGVGFPARFDPESTESFGWRLIRSLAAQLGGAVAASSGTGVRVDVRFPSSGSGGGSDVGRREGTP